MKKNNQNTFKLRVKNADTLQSLHELYESGNFEFMNDLLNAALEYGVEKIYLEYGKHKCLATTKESPDNSGEKLDDIQRRMRKLELSFDDVVVLLNVLETLCAITLNLKIADVKKEPIEPALIDSGFYGDLPKFLQQIKDEVTRRISKRE